MAIQEKQLDILDAQTLRRECDYPVALAQLPKLAPGGRVELIAPPDPVQLLTWIIEAFPLRFDFSPLERGGARTRYELVARASPSPRTVSDYLAWDHDRLDAMLARALDNAQDGHWKEVRSLLLEFSHGLLRHIDIEERILFPVFEQRSGMFFGGPTSVMRHEHGEIKTAIDGLVRASQQEDLKLLWGYRSALFAVLEGHNAKEEDVLYPAIDRLHEDMERNDLVVRLLLG